VCWLFAISAPFACLSRHGSSTSIVWASLWCCCLLCLWLIVLLFFDCVTGFFFGYYALPFGFGVGFSCSLPL
jgi:hypothetical protein